MRPIPRWKRKPFFDLVIPPKPRTALGFERPERASSGTPPTEDEIADFTAKLTGFYKDVGYFDWLRRISHGLDASYDPEMFDYKLWWAGCRDAPGRAIRWCCTTTDGPKTSPNAR